MDKDLLVQNIIRYCTVRGEPPTVACVNAGLGKDFLSDIKRGRTPSVSKVADMAAYLNVSTSDLIGDNVSNLDTKKEPVDSENSEEASRLLDLLSQLNEEGRERLLEYADDLVSSGKYIKNYSDIINKQA